MTNRPAQVQRVLLRVINGCLSKAKAARILEISRKTLYIWLSEVTRLDDKAVRPPKPNKEIIKIVASNPAFGPQKISKALNSYGIRLSTRSVWLRLKALGLSKRLDREIYSQRFKQPLGGHPRLTPESRKRLVEDVILSGNKVIETCSSFALSRKSFAKWKRRYLEAQDAQANLLNALSDQNPKGPLHPRGISLEIENKVLSLVASEPHLSSHKIASRLQIIGNHGVQRILERNYLNLYQMRLSYSQAQRAAAVPAPEVTFWDRVRLVWESFIPSLAPAPPPFLHLLKTFTVSFGLSSVFFLSTIYWINLLGRATSFSVTAGLLFASVALFFGSFFFLYSMKYYLTLALVLSFSQQGTQEKNSKKRRFLSWILGSTNDQQLGTKPMSNTGPVGLESSLEHVALKRHPYLSVHIPFYNEKNVVERAISAATNFDYQGDYEVILCDDSTDETTQIIFDYLKVNGSSFMVHRGEGYTLTKAEVRPGVVVKHLHRTSREGFKGGALRLALKFTDPKAEFVTVFDADFVPYPDTLTLFRKYFSASSQATADRQATLGRIAAVQGYQWHVLNKSENWITRGIRSEYAGSYVIERSGAEIYSGLKQISGAVYMIRRDVLDEVGWDTSITEDFELTLKLYEKGYKVVYTPYIQAPAECVSTIKRLVRQRMRWAEGHSHNIKKMFLRLLASPKLTRPEKLEFLYLSPYYLQAFFFLIGTFSWLISETIFPARLPFWTSLWGWSLVLTNLLSLPLMNGVGLFLEEAEERDYSGLLSFVTLSYILVPFQAYASLKGFLEKQEGPWFRTPKSGKITDIFTRGRFYRFISGILPGRSAPAISANQFSIRTNQYVALATANNRFNSFKIKPKQIRWISKSLAVGLLIVVMSLGYLSNLIIPLAPLDNNILTAEASEIPPMQTIDPSLFAVPSDYPSLVAQLDQDNIGQLMTTNLTSASPSVQLSVTSESGAINWIKITPIDASTTTPPSQSSNSLLWQDVKPGVPLEYQTFDGYLNQMLTLPHDGVEKVFSFRIEKSENLSLEDYSGHLLVKDKDTQEELFFLRYPQGIDAQNQRIDYKYEIQGDSIRLYPNRTWQLEKAVYPIRIFAPLNVIAWSEAMVQVGENCPEPACGKDGDVDQVRPTGWHWGTEERRLHVQVKLPKMKEAEREEYTSKTQDRPEKNEDGTEPQLTQKQEERLFSVEGLARYGLDYSKPANPSELAKTRDKNKKEHSPSLDAKKDKSVIKKKTNLLLSVIPQDRRLAYQPEPKAGLLTRLFHQIVRSVSADTTTVKTIGSASRDFSDIATWESTQQGDLTAAGALHGIQEGDLYNDSTFTLTAVVTINGSTTNSTHYMILTVPAGERHNGTATSGVLIDCANGAFSSFEVVDNFFRAEWMRITRCGNSNGRAAFRIAGATDVLLQYHLIYNFDYVNVSTNGIAFAADTLVSSATIRNSIIYDTDSNCIRGDTSGTDVDTATIQNVTCLGNSGGTQASRGINDDAGANDFDVTNSIAMATSTEDFQLNNTGSTSTTNVSEDATGTITNKVVANQFVNSTAGSEDLHLKTGSDAIDVGTTIADFSTDIDNQTRPIGSAWDIGADEIPENLWALILLAPFAAGLVRKLKRTKR